MEVGERNGNKDGMGAVASHFPAYLSYDGDGFLHFPAAMYCGRRPLNDADSLDHRMEGSGMRFGQAFFRKVVSIHQPKNPRKRVFYS